MHQCFKMYRIVLPQCKNVSNDVCPYVMWHLNFWWKLHMFSSSPILLALIWLALRQIASFICLWSCPSHLSEIEFIMWTQALQHPKMWQLEALSHCVAHANCWIFPECHIVPPPILNYSMYSTGREFISSCASRLLVGALLCLVFQQHCYTKWRWAGLRWMLRVHSLQWLPCFFSSDVHMHS